VIVVCPSSVSPIVTVFALLETVIALGDWGSVSVCVPASSQAPRSGGDSTLRQILCTPSIVASSDVARVVPCQILRPRVTTVSWRESCGSNARVRVSEHRVRSEAARTRCLNNTAAPQPLHKKR
jgi:hypothetical protein